MHSSTWSTTWRRRTNFVMCAGRSARRGTKNSWGSKAIQFGSQIAQGWFARQRSKQSCKPRLIQTWSFDLHFNAGPLLSTRLGYVITTPSNVGLRSWWRPTPRSHQMDTSKSRWSNCTVQICSCSSRWWRIQGLESNILEATSRWKRPLNGRSMLPTCVCAFNPCKDPRREKLRHRKMSPRKPRAPMTSPSSRRLSRTCRARWKISAMHLRARPLQRERRAKGKDVATWSSCHHNWLGCPLRLLKVSRYAMTTIERLFKSQTRRKVPERMALVHALGVPETSPPDRARDAVTRWRHLPACSGGEAQFSWCLGLPQLAAGLHWTMCGPCQAVQASTWSRFQCFCCWSFEESSQTAFSDSTTRSVR